MKRAWLQASRVAAGKALRVVRASLLHNLQRLPTWGFGLDYLAVSTLDVAVLRPLTAAYAWEVHLSCRLQHNTGCLGAVAPPQLHASVQPVLHAHIEGASTHRSPESVGQPMGHG